MIKRAQKGKRGAKVGTCEEMCLGSEREGSVLWMVARRCDGDHRDLHVVDATHNALSGCFVSKR